MYLDATDWKILTALQIDSRQSFTALGQQVGLSGP
ncbi:MAG: AsnC family protein, partial [Cyanobacteria bacterium J06627_8]